MRIQELFEGDVIDARDRFSASANKIKNADDALKNYHELEQTLSKELYDIDQYPNSAFTKSALMPIYVILHHHRSNVPFTKPLMWAITEPEDYDSKQHLISINFIKTHRQQILNIIETQLKKLFDLEKKLRNENIPPSVLVHTKFHFIKSELNELHDFYRTIK